MKNRAIKKLNSESGVSILFALFLFTVVSVVVIILISASYTAVKRVNNNKKVTQDQLLLDSAARLLNAEITDADLSKVQIVIVTTTTSVSVDGGDPSVTEEVSDPEFVTPDPGGFMTDELGAAVEAVYGGSDQLIEISLSTSDSSLQKVKCRMTMSDTDAYNIKAVLSTESGSSYMNLSWKGKVGRNTTDSDPDVNTVTTGGSSGGSWWRPGGGSSKSTTTTTTTQTSTETTTITWKADSPFAMNWIEDDEAGD